MKTKRKKGKKGLLIALGVVGAVIAGFAMFLGIGLGLKDALIKNVDITKVPNGNYTGELTGSRFGNKLMVTVSAGKITDIQISSDMVVAIPDVSSKIFSEVKEKQSLQVDCVSGATVSSKAYLMSLENALSEK